MGTSRNRPKAPNQRKFSEALTSDQVALIRAAARRARDTGLPLNLAIQLDWTMAGIGEPVQPHMRTFMMNTRSYFHERKIALRYLWTIENSDGHLVATIFVHMPRELINNFYDDAKTFWASRIARKAGSGARSNFVQGLILNDADISDMISGADPTARGDRSLVHESTGAVLGRRFNYSNCLRDDIRGEDTNQPAEPNAA